MSKSMQPVVERVMVTPAMAKKWLDVSRENRKISDAYVEAYARDMIAGAWVPWVSMIILGTDGAVLDGQHRLAAIAKSGISCGFVVMFNDGMGKSAKNIPIDGQRGRSANFVLDERAAYCAVARVAIAAMNRWSTSKVTHREIGEVIDVMRDHLDRMFTLRAGDVACLTTAAVRCSFIFASMTGFGAIKNPLEEYAKYVLNESDIKSLQRLSFRLLAKREGGGRDRQRGEMYLTMRALERPNNIPTIAGSSVMNDATQAFALSALVERGG